MTARWFDNLSWSAPLGPTQGTARRPTAQALGMTRASYFNNAYFGSADGVVDIAKAKEIGNCLPAATMTMFDFETWLAKCATYSGAVMPAPNRAVYQKAIVDSLAAVRSTPRGRSCQYMPYQATLGLGAHNFGEAWISANLAAQQTIFHEPVEGAPSGIGALFDLKLCSVYRRYSDWAYDADRIRWLAGLMRQLYPGERICGGVTARLNANDAGPRKYDYLTEDEMEKYLDVVLSCFDDVAPWDWNGYGPEGTPSSERNPANGNAIVPGTGAINGAAWNENWGWVRAMRRRMRGAIVTTVPQTPGGGVQFVGPNVR